HCVFCCDPAAALPAQPRRRLVLERSRAQHVCLAEPDKARALCEPSYATLDAHLSHLVGGAFGRTHAEPLEKTRCSSPRRAGCLCRQLRLIEIPRPACGGTGSMACACSIPCRSADDSSRHGTARVSCACRTER